MDNTDSFSEILPKPDLGFGSITMMIREVGEQSPEAQQELFVKVMDQLKRSARGVLRRFPKVRELDEDALVRILKEPKNALVNQYKHLFDIDNVELSFRDEALKEIAKQAIKRKTGARGLRSIMEELLMETMFGLPNDDLEKVIIDEKTVKSKTDPIQLLKTKSKKTSSGN